MRAKEFIVETAMMGKIADSGKIIRILKKAHTVPFSDEKNWLLVDTDPGKGNSGLGIKWIPADTRFEWVRPYKDSVDENLSPQTIHKLADHKGVKWDDEPSFLQLTKRLTGKEHLDDLDQAGLNKVKKHLDGLQGVAEGSENNNTTAQKIFFARSNKAPKGWSYDHVGFITQDGKQIQMSGHKGNDVYVTNDVTDDPEFPKQNIKIVSLSKPVSVPTTNSVEAENCGTFVANVLRANGIKDFDTQKLYSVFKKPQEQGVAEAEKKGLYYYVNKRKKAGTSRPASSPKAPTAQAWKDAAKTAKSEGVEEGWDDIKKFGKNAAVAGAIGLGIGAANASSWSPTDVPAGGHNQLPDIVAHVKFKVGDKEVSKEINLGSHYRSPGEAGKDLENFLKSKGIKFYEYSLERVKPTNNNLDSSPAIGTGNEKSSIDTNEPSSNGKNIGDYMAKEGAKVDRQAKHITASMMKKGKSEKDAEGIAWAHIKHPKNESIDTYFESLSNRLAEKLDPNAPVDDWVQDFAQANPEKYHQFRQNNRPGTRKSEKKIERMAQAASYAAKTGK